MRGQRDVAPTLRESRARAPNGPELFVRHWQPAGEVVAQLVVVHGYQEHGGRYQEFAERLATFGFATLAPDLRGHGRSGGPRGHIDKFTDYLDDVEAVLATNCAPGVPTFLCGHSQGGLIVLYGAQAGRFGGCRGLLVTNPFLALTMPVPRLKRWLGHVLGRVWPQFGLPTGIDPAWLSHDPEIVATYKRDPLLLDRATAGWFVQTRSAQAELARSDQVPLPLYFAYSDADPMVSPAANAAYAARVRAPRKTVVLRPGEFHKLLEEVDRLAIMDALAAWIVAQCRA